MLRALITVLLAIIFFSALSCTSTIATGAKRKPYIKYTTHIANGSKFRRDAAYIKYITRNKRR